MEIISKYIEIMEKKTICSLCQELREVLKYIEDDRIKTALNIVDSIQYRAHDMERGLYRSKQDVGIKLLNLIGRDYSDQDILEILINRWPSIQ